MTTASQRAKSYLVGDGTGSPSATVFLIRDAGMERPLVVPKDAENLAFLGQSTEIPEDVVLTVEYPVRGAMHAVHRLLGVKKAAPGTCHVYAHPAVAVETLKKAFAA
ncbi:oleate hydratase [Kitasatospora sp. NPDC048545]|uniref:oleate hydratase n=1 Tax=Kitasatospora sp. NPDC048545 TaxID=3157208 RepID=UPI0033DE5BD1